MSVTATMLPFRFVLDPSWPGSSSGSSCMRRRGNLGQRGSRRPPSRTVPSAPHPQGGRFVYAGSSSGVVQAPVAFCGKHGTCEDCVLARDPYCAWSRAVAACVTLHLHQMDVLTRYQGGGPALHARVGGGHVPDLRLAVLQDFDPGVEWRRVRLPR